jgi:hypothetical protein
VDKIIGLLFVKSSRECLPEKVRWKTPKAPKKVQKEKKFFFGSFFYSMDIGGGK